MKALWALKQRPGANIADPLAGLPNICDPSWSPNISATEANYANFVGLAEVGPITTSGSSISYTTGPKMVSSSYSPAAVLGRGTKG